jgi:long-chain acyl-CoA synthetase
VNHDEARRILSAPGGYFELATEEVAGRPMQVFKQRERSMREKVVNATGHGDKEFLALGDKRMTFREFGELAWGSAHALTERFGMRPKDRLAIFAFNRPEWLVTLFGATSAGATAVGLNGWWVTDEIAYGLRDSGARYLIVDEALWPRVEPIVGTVEGLEQVFFIGGAPPKGTRSIEELLARRTEAPATAIAEDDPWVILYTSGTTGRPKGCITTHRGTIAQVQGIVHNFLLAALLRQSAGAGASTESAMPASPPVTLLTSPLFHVAGLHATVCASMTAGAKLVFGPPKFEPEEIMRIIEKERVTTWMAIPTLLQRLLDHPKLGDYDLSSLNSISTGGAPAPPELLARAREVLPAKPPAGTTYGLTETHGMATSIDGVEARERPGSVGRPMPTVEVKIVDEAGNAVESEVSGEILLRGPTLTPGYWNRPDATAETIRDGWLHTGDIGYLDPDGYLFIIDRAKDMILRGGENVYCVEIENVLAEHPEIVEAAVIGIPDRDLGEKVKAVVRRTEGSTLDSKAVQAHVASRLARFKVPEIVAFTDEPLPRNPAGKILKNLLRGTGHVSFRPEAL